MVTRSRRKEVPQGHTRPTRQKGTTDWHFETSVLTRFFTLAKITNSGIPFRSVEAKFQRMAAVTVECTCPQGALKLCFFLCSFSRC
ncbi:uncharacterized protein H6S33_013035 [Morchella sextelata]|uniref:uncharacterized protein n=1 Tax=Morchella sextelata TaxID=1174677 RepID=UPI001D042E5D|nr:uncharacterized protein H6S33_013035 [Morchella sextelata]KAH0609549.1 hypothetical protein H6S33_013035 [Morchella sextelata]